MASSNPYAYVAIYSHPAQLFNLSIGSYICLNLRPGTWNPSIGLRESSVATWLW